MAENEQIPMLTTPSRLGAFMRRNPITLKELRGRMRGARAFIVLTIFVVLMSLFTVILYAIYTATSNFNLASSGGRIGKLIFGGVVTIELFLVCFIAPAFTAGAISGERERQTFNLLRTTLLPARRLIMGKLLAALAYIVLLLMVAIPLQSIAFLMGGVTYEELLISIWLLVVTAVGYGTMGIFFSTYTKRTLNASILTYTFALITTIALPLATLGLSAVTPFGLVDLQNPFFEGVLMYLFGLLGSSNPISTAVLSELVLLNQDSVFFFTMSLSNGTSLPLISPWIVFTFVVLIVSLVLLRASVRLLQKLEAV